MLAAARGKKLHLIIDGDALGPVLGNQGTAHIVNPYAAPQGITQAVAIMLLQLLIGKLQQMLRQLGLLIAAGIGGYAIFDGFIPKALDFYLEKI